MFYFFMCPISFYNEPIKKPIPSAISLLQLNIHKQLDQQGEYSKTV